MYQFYWTKSLLFLEKMIDLSIIIPSYNEYDNLKNLIIKIEKVFLSKINIEVILVNNGSTDNTKIFLKNI